MANCNLCPRQCGANREAGEIGVCGAPPEIKVALAQLHMWEEPPITGENGSGTIFFSHCPLKCVYCQNRIISAEGKGEIVSIEQLQEMMIGLQEKGAENINFVTGTQWAPQIVQAVKGVEHALHLPIVWNTSSYETLETIEMLNEIVNIYLADFKYYSNDLAKQLSSVSNYREVATKAISVMLNGYSLNNQSELKDFAENLLNSQSELKDLHESAPLCEAIPRPRLGSKRKVIIRHLVLPGHIDDSKNVIKHVHDCFGDKVRLSIMNQFTPVNRHGNHQELNRALSKEEYEEVLNYADSLGLENYFWQTGETCKESFIPNF